MKQLTNKDYNTLVAQNPGATSIEIKPRDPDGNLKFLVTYADGTEEEIELVKEYEATESDDEVEEEVEEIKEEPKDQTLWPPGKTYPEGGAILETDEDKKLFVDTLIDPPAANDKLKEAQELHSETIVDTGKSPLDENSTDLNPEDTLLDDSDTELTQEALRASNKAIIKLILEGSLPKEASDNFELGTDTLEDLIQQVRDENPELAKTAEIVEDKIEEVTETAEDKIEDVDDASVAAEDAIEETRTEEVAEAVEESETKEEPAIEEAKPKRTRSSNK